MESYKPGYKTSEFWFTLMSFIISVLFLFGIITDSDTKDQLIDVSSHVVESVILVGGQAVLLYRYINSRKTQKIEHEKGRRRKQEDIQKELEDYIGVDKRYDIININTAVIGELIQLPHIGPSTAEKIIDYRKENGKFLDIREIMRISGIGESTFKDIEKYIEL